METKAALQTNFSPIIMSSSSVYNLPKAAHGQASVKKCPSVHMFLWQIPNE